MKKKVKEVIKEENEEKDSLLNEIKYKSQAAMEYLMTYGWAILIIALSLVVLYSLGIMNPKNFIPRAPPGSCFVFRPNGPGTTDFVSLQGTCGYLPMYVASFDGVSGYISISNSQSLSPTNAITITAWVRYNSVGGVQTILRKQASFVPGMGWTSQKFRFWINNGSWQNTGDSITNAQVGKWYYIVGTYDKNGGTNNLKLYINGNLEAQSTISGQISTNTNPVIIGSNSGTYEFHNGLIANVQIYNTALTPQEIQYLYQQGLGGGPIRLGSLVGWWPLNGDAKDYSGNNNHGTIYNVTFVQNYNPP